MDSGKAFHFGVFGKLLMGTIRRANSEAKLLRDLRPGTALLAERGNLENVHDNVRPSSPLSIARDPAETLPRPQAPSEMFYCSLRSTTTLSIDYCATTRIDNNIHALIIVGRRGGGASTTTFGTPA